MSEAKKERREVSRRRFLKYGAGVVVVGAAAAAAYYALTPPSPPAPPTPTPTTTEITTVPTPTAITTAKEEPEKPNELHVLMEDFGYVGQMVSNLYEERYGIPVKMEYTDWSGVYSKMVTDAISGRDKALYDVVEVWPLGGRDLYKYRYLGALDEFMMKSGNTLDKILGLASVTKEMNSIDGLTYTVPFGFFPHILNYRTDLYKEAGLTGPPETIAQVLEYSKKLVKKSGGKTETYGFLDSWGDDNAYESWLTYLAAFGGAEFDEQGNYTMSSQYTPAVKALTWMREIWESGSVVPETITFFNTGDQARLFRTGVAGQEVIPAWVYYWYNASDSAIAGKFVGANVPGEPPIKTGTCDPATGFGVTAKGNPYWGWKWIETFVFDPHVQFDYATNLAWGFNAPPTLKAIYEPPWRDRAFSANPYLALLEEAYRNPILWPSTAHTTEIYKEALNPILHLGITGELSVAQALDECGAKIREILARP